MYAISPIFNSGQFSGDQYWFFIHLFAFNYAYFDSQLCLVLESIIVYNVYINIFVIFCFKYSFFVFKNSIFEFFPIFMTPWLKIWGLLILFPPTIVNLHRQASHSERLRLAIRPMEKLWILKHGGNDQNWCKIENFGIFGPS